MTPNQLPPLPEPDTHCFDDDTGKDVWSYTADQMHAYALAALAQQAQPVCWEWRHLGSNQHAADFGQWSQWQKVEARSLLFTVEDELRSFRRYIADGYKYELRALYTTPPAPQPAPVDEREAEIAELRAEVLAWRNQCDRLTHQVICCGVAASHPDATLTTRGAYAGKWNSGQAEEVRKLRAERDALAALQSPAPQTKGSAMSEATTKAAERPFTPAQRMRLWQNTEKGKSATSLGAFERICQTVEAAHRIGQESPQPAVPVVEAFAEGWRMAADWANRDDLLPDMDSPQYAKERDERLAELRPAVEPMTREQMIAAVRPLCTTESHAEKLVDLSMDEYRAIEAHHGITAKAEGGA